MHMNIYDIIQAIEEKETESLKQKIDQIGTEKQDIFIY